MKKFLLISIFLLFFAGCLDDKEAALEKPPVDSNIPQDVPVSQSEPASAINPELPPVPVTE